MPSIETESLKGRRRESREKRAANPKVAEKARVQAGVLEKHQRNKKRETAKDPPR